MFCTSTPALSGIGRHRAVLKLSFSTARVSSSSVEKSASLASFSHRLCQDRTTAFSSSEATILVSPRNNCRRNFSAGASTAESGDSPNSGSNTNSIGNTSNESLTLYQYAICPFCNIVKSVLHYHKLPYKAVEVNPLTKGELNQLPKDYRKVPILTTGSEQQFNGSETIVEYIIQQQQQQQQQSDQNYGAPSKLLSEDPEWESYARDDLAPLLYPNICQTWSRAHETMGYIHGKDEFTTFQKYSIQWIGSFAMYLAASKIKKKRQITDEKQALYDTLQRWEDHLESRKTRQGDTGSEVTLGDLSIYGVLRGLQGLPIHSDISKDFSNISLWYKEMENCVEG